MDFQALLDEQVVSQVLVNGLIALAIAITGYFVSVIVSRMVVTITSRFLDPGVAGFLGALSRVAVMVYALSLIFDQIGVAGVIVVLVTALTGAFALGSERIASDLVAGFNLLLLRFYRVGDIVTISEHHGKIAAISLTHTSLDTKTRDRIIIPNSEIFSQVIVNHTATQGVQLRAEIRILGAHDRGVIVDRILAAAQSFEPQLRGPGEQAKVLLQEVYHAEGEMESVYVAMIFAPNTLYGHDYELLLHIRHTLDQQDAEQEAAEAQESADDQE
jgi:small-conductance mechanosensitive channel